MSEPVSALNNGLGLGPLQQVVGNALGTKAELDLLTEQASSGYVSSTYGGLDPASASTVLSLSPQIAAIAATTTTLNAVTGRMGVQQSAFTQIDTLVTSVVSSFATLTSGTTTSQAFQGAVAGAQQALLQVTSLLNSTEGSVYVFGGQDSGEAPVPAAANFLSTGFYTQISAAIASLGTNGAAATTSAVMTFAGSTASGTSPFAPGLQATSGLPSVQTAPGQPASQETVIGIAADANGFVTSTGAGTTGSYMRDILGGLAAVSALTPSQSTATGFGGFMQSIQTILQNATAAMNEDAGILGNNQAAITAQVSSLQDASTALATQVSDADNVDMAATLSKLSSVQTALQGSYQLIATMNSLSLTAYISA